MTWIELFLAVICILVSTYLGAKVGFRISIFTTLSIVGVIGVLIVPFHYFRKVAQPFYPIVHENIAEILSLIFLSVLIVAPLVVVSRFIDSRTKSLSKTGNAIFGLCFGLVLSITTIRLIYMGD